jgi:ABC-2 type transport system ATP-binding protein
MAAIIEIKELTKVYPRLTALDSLNLSVEEGSVVGFIGPNGAGKTTTMRILTTLLQPTRGEAWVAGHSVLKNPKGVRRAIGYMPDFFGVYDDMMVWEYLDFFAACYDIPEAARSNMIGDLLALVDLSHKRDTFVNELSRGMKQRLCLARTLTHDPQVLILDEPASGLDPRARIEMRALLLELRQMGKTIFFSSHILSEVADICTHLAILEAGRLVAFGHVDAMRRQLRTHRVIQVQILDRAQELQELLIRREDVNDIKAAPEAEQSGGLIRFEFVGDDRALSELLATVIAAGVPVASFGEETSDIEDVFMQATKGLVS